MSSGNIARRVGICLLLCSGFAAAQTATTTNLASSPNQANLGQAVTLTATVTSGATGKVTFYDGTTILGVSAVSGGQATWSTVLLPSGARSLRAYYQGDAGHAASTSAVVAEAVHALPSLGLQPPVAYAVGTSPSSAVLGDFNGDGKQDLAVANASVNGTISVLLGNGSGGFQAAASYSAGPGLFLAVGDFNGDGKPDLVEADASVSFNILLGNGDGTFQAPTPFPNGTTPKAVAVGDFNGDGKADLAFVGNLVVVIVLGNGDGTFQAPVSVNFPYSGSSLVVADFNGDGKADIAAGTSRPGFVSVLLGNGDGTFHAAVNYPFGTLVIGVAACDLNGDGILDLVAVDYLSGVGVLLGKGDGTFQSAVAYPGVLDPDSVAVGDINGDGKQDLVTVFEAGAILFGNGDGTFQPATAIPQFSGPASVTVGDFNGDGITDLAVLRFDAGVISVYLGGIRPDLTISINHGNGLTQGQVGADYNVTVSNIGPIASAGTVSVVDALPLGLTATAIAGEGWTCVLSSLTCTRPDSLAPGASYPVIEITVNVPSGLTGIVTDSATVSGGSDGNPSNNIATDVSATLLPTATLLTVGPNPSILSQTVTLTARITAGATGNVTFYDLTTVLGIATIAGGQAALSSDLLLPGSHSITARYDGDSTYGPSLSAVQAIIISSQPLNGYQPRLSYPVFNPFSLAVGDFNLDGKPDIVTAASRGGMSVLLGNGDGSLQAAVNYPVASAGLSTAVRVGDFNGDGIPDVAVNSTSLNFGIYVFLGNGDGTFQTPLGSATSSEYHTFVVADFDGDGKLDIAASTGTGVDLLIGNGDGTFRLPITMASGLQNVMKLIVADVDEDGKPDLIVGSGATVQILLGNGNGTFRSGSTYALNITTQSIAAGDFNGDGKTDIVETYPSAAAVLLGNGDGTFQPPIQTLFGTFAGYNLVAGDFNGDGKLDVAFSGDSIGNIAIALGNGDGTFQTAIVIPTDGPPGTNEPNIVIADFNRDGIPDLAVANYSSSSVNVFLGGQFAGLLITSTHRGPLTAGQTKTYTITVTNPTLSLVSPGFTVTGLLPVGFTATAMSGDYWNCTLSTITCTYNNGLGSGSTSSPISFTVMAAANLTPSTVTTNVSVTSGGITNSVGDPTIIVSPTNTLLSASPNPSVLDQAVTLTATVSAGVGTVAFLEDENLLGTATLSGNHANFLTHLIPAGVHKVTATYAGDSTHGASTSSVVSLAVNAGSATSLTAVANLIPGIGPVGILIGDLNGDGNADLVTPNSYSNTVSVFFGNGDGTFQPKTDYAVGLQPSGAAIADFNGDGKPDIAVSNRYGGIDGSISILLNNGDGTFRAGATLAALLPLGILAADFDGDGKADLAVVGNSGAVTVFFGVGDGTFQSASGPCCPGGPLALGDFNGDGKPDLVSGLSIFLNQGNGIFGSGGFNNVSYYPAVGDLNRDGKADLVAAGYSTGVDVLLGNGDGTFQPSVHYNTGPAGAVTLADTNGDGKLDVIVANSGDNTISVLLGNGDGTLQPAIPYTVGSGPSGIVAGDFNGDGRTDLAVANLNSLGTVTILLGSISAVLNITNTHTASFYPGQTGATYTITVSNNGPGATLGTLTVTDLLPTGLTATALAGSGWTCVLSTLTCTRSDALAVSASYPPITLTVNAAANAPIQVTNMVSVSGGNTVGSSASDPTVILNLPGAPVLSSPSNGATGVSTTPVMSWTAASGAASYNVYFGVTAAPPLAANTTSLQYTPSQLAPGKTYYWQVAAVNAAGSMSSPVFSFTTLGTPQASHVGIFRSGFFWLLDADGNEAFNSPPDLAFPFGGIAGDIPITGDWTGNGHTKVGIYRPSNGLFILDTNGDGVLDAGDAVFNFEAGIDPTDIPVIGDWNGSGTSKVGLFRQGFFWILDYNGNHVFEQNTDKTYAFGGVPGDLPVVGDWNGSGTSKIGIFRLGFYWILDANGNGSFDVQDYAFPYGGISNDVPVVGDWNGSGISKVGVFREGFFWVLDGNNPGDPTHSIGSAFAFGGITNDKPVTGKW